MRSLIATIFFFRLILSSKSTSMSTNTWETFQMSTKFSNKSLLTLRLKVTCTSRTIATNTIIIIFSLYNFKITLPWNFAIIHIFGIKIYLPLKNIPYLWSTVVGATTKAFWNYNFLFEIASTLLCTRECKMGSDRLWRLSRKFRVILLAGNMRVLAHCVPSDKNPSDALSTSLWASPPYFDPKDIPERNNSLKDFNRFCESGNGKAWNFANLDKDICDDIQN